MAFFPTVYNTNSSFTPLFRLLDDFDKYSRSEADSGTSPIFHWQPKFDVRETSDAYHFHGELPGLTKDQISIEFPEPQSIVIRGKTERTYTSGTPPAGLLDSSEKPAAVTDGSERRNSHQATVEDEGGNDANLDETEVATAAIKSQEPEKPADGAKFWLTERSIGEFSRHFNFPARIDQDAVIASLKDGVLNVEVPKAKKHETRRITVN